MTDLSSLQQRASDLHLAEESLYSDLSAFFKGKSVRILCPRYNGQPHGRSKPKLQGQVLPVAWASEHRGRIYLGFADYQDSIELSLVEVLS